jgi:hypothetical protein
MTKRPTSITVIGIIHIAGGILTTIGPVLLLIQMQNPEIERQVQDILKTRQFPLPIPVFMSLIIAVSILYVICGLGVMKAQNWARMMFVGIGLVCLSIGLVDSDKIAWIQSFLIEAALMFFLFNGKANSYFKNSHENSNAELKSL